MKKKKIQNIIIVAIAIVIIGSIAAYNYSVEQTKQQGLQFGKELEQIQEDVKQLQTKFYSEKTRWEEEDISKEELLEFYEEHLKEFKGIISRYDKVTPPELFKSSVELLKISSETQLESDSQFIEWIKTGDKSAKIRSDTQFQEALEYEMLGLVEFYSAKTGVKNYEEPEKFEAPQSGLTQKVIQVSENMKSECDNDFRNESGEFDSERIEIDWFNCVNEAKNWKVEHLP
ncbi:MAG: hypothetical protein OEM77_05230 [Nitrosopumilus sp.]|nr:hypothetical protein [Nitrosopumilus sp.]MDH3736273.1 hypothetical protein [Nitrosopumilus sp.]MDH3822345.1 hypothetical protein [Nitrosopumilus sp.]MDH3833571.1 hypothetical protein [Nitrosopumilus sp.]